MAEKDVTKKLLILLVILVALSLVVDLLSFNVLYGIGKEPSSSATSGELATSPYRDCYDGCMFGSQYECVDECLYGGIVCTCCEWDRVESCRRACGKSARKTPPYC